MIGSIIGFLAESVVAFVQKGFFESRQGLVYGPFVPIYGLGAIAYYFITLKVKDTKKVFIVCFVFGGMLEYLFSYMQQTLFGTISWDYSELMFNLNGRTSLLHCLYWGTAGVLFIKVLSPMIENMKDTYTKKWFRIATQVCVVFMVVNIVLSWGAANRQEERMKDIPPQSSWDHFLDRNFPDEIMNKIYANKIEKLKK